MDSSRRPNAATNSRPNSRAATPRITDTVTWPKPHRAVMRTVRPADQRCARPSAANGTQ